MRHHGLGGRMIQPEQCGSFCDAVLYFPKYLVYFVQDASRWEAEHCDTECLQVALALLIPSGDIWGFVREAVDLDGKVQHAAIEINDILQDDKLPVKGVAELLPA